MVSEIDNILNGEVVRKVNADKAIGVSTANLMPDEKGEVPLSKQSAFIIPTAQESLDITESLDLTPSTQEPEALETLITPTSSSEDLPEAVQMNPTEEIIEKSPVEVAPPDGLGSIDFDSLIPNIPLVEDKPTPEEDIVVQEEKVELPQEQEPVQAEEPVGIDTGLFVSPQSDEQSQDAFVAESDNETTQKVFESDAEPVQTEEQQTDVEESEIPLLEPDSKDVIEYPSDTQDTDYVDEELKVEDTNEPFLDQTTDTYESDTELSDTVTPKETAEPEEFDEIKDVQSEEENTNSPKQDNNLEAKLDIIIEKLNSLGMMIDELKSINALLSEIERVINSKSMESSVEQVSEQVPDLTQSSSLEPPAEEVLPQVAEEPQEEMVDAFSQIPGYDGSSIDETPIKGGMFI